LWQVGFGAEAQGQESTVIFNRWGNAPSAQTSGSQRLNFLEVVGPPIHTADRRRITHVAFRPGRPNLYRVQKAAGSTTDHSFSVVRAGGTIHSSQIYVTPGGIKAGNLTSDPKNKGRQTLYNSNGRPVMYTVISGPGVGGTP